MKKFDWIIILCTSGEFYLQMITAKTLKEHLFVNIPADN